MALCTQCRRRPRPKNDSRMTCIPCTKVLEHRANTEKDRLRQVRDSRPTNYRQYTWLLHWKGCLVGIRPDPLEPGEVPKSTAVRIDFGLDIAKLPQDKLINVDLWLPHYTKDQIMYFKRVLRQLFPEFLVRQSKKGVRELEPVG